MHEVSVVDLGGCGDPFTKEIYVIGFPKFFTPNGDANNPTWNVKLNPSEPIEMSIYIYDRFGRMLKQISPTGEGWDGTFAGKQLPSDDYWFIATLEESTETYTSHFTLKR